jgi:hypothetical protein
MKMKSLFPSRKKFAHILIFAALACFGTTNLFAWGFVGGGLGDRGDDDFYAELAARPGALRNAITHHPHGGMGDVESAKVAPAKGPTDEFADLDKFEKGKDKPIPTGPDAVPVGEGAVPVGEGAVPVGEGAVPVGEGAVPVGEGAVPVGEGAVPVGEGAVPVGEGAYPTSNRSPSLGGWD